MKYAHYAPQGLMQLVKGEASAVAAFIQAAARTAQSQGERTGVLAFAEHAGIVRRGPCPCRRKVSRSWKRLRMVLYAALREFDELGVQRIWAEACKEEGIGQRPDEPAGESSRPPDYLRLAPSIRLVMFPVLSAV